VAPLRPHRSGRLSVAVETATLVGRQRERMTLRKRFAGGHLRPLLVIAVKAPAPGRVKTRLTVGGELSAEGAALLAAASLLDTVEACRHPCVGAEVRIALDGDPADQPEELSREGSPPTFPQKGGSLGERLIAVFSDCFDEAAGRPVCVIGGDAPHLPPALLAEAFGRLATGGTDAVLGPSEDGGYYLVGLKSPQPELFRDIPWSTDAVLSETLARAADSRVAAALLPRWYDIDTPEDVARLRTDLARGTASAPNTRAALDRLARETEL